MSRAMVELNSTSATAKTTIKGAMASSWKSQELPTKQTASRPSRRRRYVLSYHLQLHDAHLYPQILTPADFALINDLRLQAATKAVESGGGPAAKGKLASLEAAKKADYEERMASIAHSREGREKLGSLKGKHRKETPSSSTNREKARNEPIMMVNASDSKRCSPCGRSGRACARTLTMRRGHTIDLSMHWDIGVVKRSTYRTAKA